MSAFKSFLQNLLQDLTPLHVKITRSTNLLSMSVCRRKLKFSTYLNTVSYNHIKLSQCALKDSF